VCLKQAHAAHPIFLSQDGSCRHKISFVGSLLQQLKIGAIDRHIDSKIQDELGLV
jgi:hypothetical protein